MGNFINQGFLWMMIPLAAAPIIIHLLNRRKHRNVPWAAMRFLEAAFKRTNRRVRMEHLILLLLRILLMLLIVLAISRPMVSRDSALAVIGQDKRNLILVVDTSYSMNYRGGVTETHFDRALDISKTILGDLSTKRGDTLTLVAMGESPEVLQERSAWIEKSTEDLGLLDANAGRADVKAALTRVLKICDHPEMQAHAEIVLVSDFQAIDWEEGTGTPLEVEDPAAPSSPAAETEGADDGDAATLRDLLAEITERRVPLTMIDVGSTKTWNLAVTSFETEEKAIGIRRPVRISAEVTNWGSEYSSPTVSLWDGDNKVSTKTLGSMGPEEKKTITFFHTFLEAGSTGLRVEVDPEVKDRLPEDNTRFQTLNVLDRIRVLVVDGDPHKVGEREGPLESETGYLKLALDPQFDTPLETTSLFSIEEAFEYNLGLKTFAEYDWIAIANLRELPDAKARELTKAVREGAGLLLFLGDQVDPALYNDRIFGEDRLLPGSLGAALESDQGYDFAASDFTHPALRFFAPEEIQPLLTGVPKTRGYLPYTPGANRDSLRVLATLTNEAGSPAICENLVGDGKVILFTTSANAEWTNFPKNFGFLPMMQEIGTYLAARDPYRQNLLTGESIVLELPRFSSNAFVEMPNGEKRSVDVTALENDEQRFLLTFEDTRVPGIYTVGGTASRSTVGNDDGDASENPIFALNVSQTEGNLGRIAENEVRTRFPEVEFSWRRDYVRATDDSGRPREGEIWKYLLASVLGLLLLEGVLAQYFGDYSRR